VEVPGVNCTFCHSTHIRFSRIRIPDLPWLLLLKVPVRCWSCQERVYANIFSTWQLAIPGKPPAKRTHRRKTERAVSKDSATA
ncbi:MAG: hypothetical protein WAV06_09855, partial [Terracidiphilus sp.]